MTVKHIVQVPGIDDPSLFFFAFLFDSLDPFHHTLVESYNAGMFTVFTVSTTLVTLKPADFFLGPMLKTFRDRCCFHNFTLSIQNNPPNGSSADWARSMERHSVIQQLADAIFEGFVKPDGGQYLSRTGTIVDQPSLRVRKTRKAFALVRDAAKEVKSKRFWTKACFRQAVGLMMKQKGLEVPMTSGFIWKEWLKEQVSCLHDLAQKARRNQWRMDMDTSPTLPWNPEEPFWGLTVADHILLAF